MAFKIGTATFTVTSLKSTTGQTNLAWRIRNAISGGLLAFCEYPSAWEKLRADTEQLPDAVEEILRWVSPISHFTRTAMEDCELRGETIHAGDQLALYFASANRDEEVFDDPFAFRVDRRPNPHLAFGFGEHFCMGAHVARVELETIFRHLLTRLDSFEVTGPVERWALRRLASICFRVAMMGPFDSEGSCRKSGFSG